MAEPANLQTLEAKIAELDTGNLVYAHPAHLGLEYAYFGKVESRTHDGFTIEKIGIAFGYETEQMSKKHAWIIKPDQYLDNKPYRRAFTFDEIKNGGVKLYVGPLDIMKGMRENDNRNVDYVISVMQLLGHNAAE